LTRRYRRLVRALGIRSTLHKLRHYSATELLAAGVDVHTVSGRLGHSEGGTTLAYYAAWVHQADQRASRILAQRLPKTQGSTCDRTAAHASAQPVPGHRR
jgi:integrase